MIRPNLKAKILVAATLAVSTFIAPVSGVVAEATTIKAKSNVNVRASNYNTSSRIDYVRSGEVVEYLGVSNGWYKVKVDGKVGYTYRSYWKGHTVSATGNVNMRSKPSSSSSKVDYIYRGTEVKVLGRNGSWLYLEYAGKKGFSHRNYWKVSTTLFNSLPFVNSTTTTATKTSSTTSSTGARIVEEAYKLLGARYVTGGDSWADGGFDCSGLTQYVYRRLGISIPRTTSQQWYGISNKVSASNRRVGDIIIFEKYGRIYHAGIYIGDNKMIHSPTAGERVSVKSLSWYQENGRIKGYLRPTK